MKTDRKRAKAKRPRKKRFPPYPTASSSAHVTLNDATPNNGQSAADDGASSGLTIDMDLTIPERNGSQSFGLFQRLSRALFGRQLRLPIYHQDDAPGEMSGSKTIQAFKIAVLVVYTVAAIMPFVPAPDPWVNRAFLIANAFILLIVLPVWGLLNGRIRTNNPRYIAPYFVWTILANMIGHPMAYQFGYYDEPSYGWPSLLLALQTLVFWFVELFYVEHEKSKK